MPNTSRVTFDLIIRNGTVVTSRNTQVMDVGVREGKIQALEPHLSARAKQEIDATGRLVFPGFIDAHTHMGIPIKTTTSADDFSSGSLAAAFGGITTIIDFTVQEKGQSLIDSLEERISRARGKSYVDFHIHVNVTDQPERWLSQIPEIIRRGFRSFKTFSTYREAGMMVTWPQFRTIMEAVSAAGGLVMLHAEDNTVVEEATQKHLDEGQLEPIYHARSRPASAEARAIEQAARIAGELQAPLYIVHLSSAAGLAVALRAKQGGVPLFIETCPQYLLLDKSVYLNENGHYFITTPPLRTRSDQQALWQALSNNQVDVVGTDHCPFTREQKEMGQRQFHQTPNGLPGVETLFPLLYTYGVQTGRMTLQQLVQVLGVNPARIFGLEHRKGDIRVGLDADLVIWNPRETTRITGQHQHGRADWSPYEGMTIAGKLEWTLLRGNVLVHNDQLMASSPDGQLIPAKSEIS
ncbi:MAG: dihydropyrimidinase [Calditrichaeota bacterium]|nr:dihydropyrimidinase [Calditrichota bacterium]